MDYMLIQSKWRKMNKLTDTQANESRTKFQIKVRLRYQNIEIETSCMYLYLQNTETVFQVILPAKCVKLIFV